MSILPHSPLPIPYETGFSDNDSYSQKQQGVRLSRALKNVSQPMVLAVDGAWGSGKSHFLRGWSGAHGLDGTVVYLDAFKHDYLDDPLMSLVQEIAARSQGEAQRRIVSIGKKLLPIVGKVVARLATMGAVAELSDIGDIVADELGDAAQQKLDALWQQEQGRHAAMETFRLGLAAMLEKTERLVIIIDELDRCRPDYALQMLEVLKHFFDVENVHFVLGVNMEQLAHMVRARYGVGVDGEKYLQRFVNAVFRLHVRPYSAFRKSSAFTSYFASLDPEDEYTLESVALKQIAPGQEVTFRDMERLHTICQLTSWNGGSGVDHQIFAVLRVIKACRPAWIDAIMRGEDVSRNINAFFGAVNGEGETKVVTSNNGIKYLVAMLGIDVTQPHQRDATLEQKLESSSLNPHGQIAEICATALAGFDPV